MGFIPHPPLYLTDIRTNDIWLLIAVGAAWELLARLYLLSLKVKPQSLLKKEETLDVVQQETEYKRKMGPAAFVETSKLERQLLAMEKELQEIRAQRKIAREKTEKFLLRYGNITIAFIIFVLYYGVPVLTVEDYAQRGFEDELKLNFKALLFPISYMGLGIRVSKWGMPKDVAMNSIGALVVLWSSQVTVGKIMDAVDAYIL